MKHFYRLRSDEGAVLVLAMLFIAALTMMGVAGIITSSTDMMITGNVRQQSVAFYQGEAGWQQRLRWARDLRAANISNPTNAVEQTTGDPMAQDPTTNNFGYSGLFRNNSLGTGQYEYRLVCLDPTAPAGFPSISPKQDKTGFSGKKTTGYSGSTKMHDYYYRIDSTGRRASNLAIDSTVETSNISVVATYRSDN